MISKKYKEVIKNLEDNIDNKTDLEYAKKQISDLTVLYIDELNNIIESFDKKLKGIENKISNVESKVEKLEDSYIEEVQNATDLDIEPITCPYCDFKFFIEYNTNNYEIQCPKCENIIELDWEEDDM